MSETDTGTVPENCPSEGVKELFTADSLHDESYG